MPAVRKKCPHTREKDFYQECGGASICEHDRRRSTCKSCGGSAICEHSRVRSSCKVCGSFSICEHSYIRSRCTICGGGSICEHNHQRSEWTSCVFGRVLHCVYPQQVYASAPCHRCCLRFIYGIMRTSQQALQHPLARKRPSSKASPKCSRLALGALRLLELLGSLLDQADISFFIRSSRHFQT